MWGEVLGAFVALVGVLATTNLLVGGQSRRRKQLGEELELLTKMPDGMRARWAFEEYLTESLELYVDTEWDRELTESRLRKRLRLAGLTVVIGSVAVLGTGVALMVHDGKQWLGWGDGMQPAGWTALAVAGLGLLTQQLGFRWFARTSRALKMRRFAVARSSKA